MFSEDIFAGLISLIFIIDGVRLLFYPFPPLLLTGVVSTRTPS